MPRFYGAAVTRRITRIARGAAILVVGAALVGTAAQAGELNLAVYRCDAYQNQILNSAPDAQAEDAVNLVMWMYGYAVARSGARAIATDGLQAFGNALDLECKAHPAASVLDALLAVKPVSQNSMDLSGLYCGAYERRHADLERSDPESAKTIMMWLYGFATGTTGGHSVDSGAVGPFAQALAAACAKDPDSRLYDTLIKIKLQKPRK